jgi:hypothetical protein
VGRGFKSIQLSMCSNIQDGGLHLHVLIAATSPLHCLMAEYVCWNCLVLGHFQAKMEYIWNCSYKDAGNVLEYLLWMGVKCHDRSTG